MVATDPYIDRAKQLAVNTLRRVLLLRARSYKRVFGPGLVTERDREIVLADLRGFCRGNSTTFSDNPIVSARWQGRREVWLRVTQHLNLDEEQIQKLVEIDDGQE